MRSATFTFLLSTWVASGFTPSIIQQPHGTIFHRNNQFSNSRNAHVRSGSCKCKTTLNMSTTSRNSYDILGVSKSAGFREIKMAYRRLVKLYHPDANLGKDTMEIFKEINRAYEILSNPEMKKMRDMYGERMAYTTPPPPPPQPIGTRGKDLHVNVEVDSKTILYGGETKVHIPYLETCNTCEGKGIKPDGEITTCQVCKGKGKVIHVSQTLRGCTETKRTCPNCHGIGQVEEPCGTCAGEGRTTNTRQIKVNIPAGAEEGNKLLIRGGGDAGLNGGPHGDLYIVLKAKPNGSYRRSLSYVDHNLAPTLKVPVVYVTNINPNYQP